MPAPQLEEQCLGRSDLSQKNQTISLNTSVSAASLRTAWCLCADAGPPVQIRATHLRRVPAFATLSAQVPHCVLFAAELLPIQSIDAIASATQRLDVPANEDIYQQAGAKILFLSHYMLLLLSLTLYAALAVSHTICCSRCHCQCVLLCLLVSLLLITRI